MRRKILDKLNIFTKINGTASLEIAELDVLPKIRETEDTTPAEEAQPATLSRKGSFINRLKKLLKWN